MSNQPKEEKPQKSFSEFQSGLVNLNLKRNRKRQANKGTDNKENDPFESDIANLLEQLKNQNNEIKKIGNSTNEINSNLKSSVPQPIFQPKNQSAINVGPDLPKQSLDFNFNIVTKDPGGNYSSSFSSSPTKKEIIQPYYPPQIIQQSSVLNSKPKNSIIQEIQDVEELSIDSKNNKTEENEPKQKLNKNIEGGNTNTPFDFSNSQTFHIENNPSNKQKNDLLISGDNNLKGSNNNFVNPQQSNNLGFVVEMDSDAFDKDKKQSSKGFVNEIDKVPLASSHRAELKPELNNEFNFDVNEIVNSLSDDEEKEKEEQREKLENDKREREEKEREERERDRILKEEEERLERERLEKEEEERKEIERIKKERLEKEKKEKEEKEKKLKEKRERQRIEREKKEKEEKERLEREKEEELKKKKKLKLKIKNKRIMIL